MSPKSIIVPVFESKILKIDQLVGTRVFLIFFVAASAKEKISPKILNTAKIIIFDPFDNLPTYDYKK